MTRGQIFCAEALDLAFDKRIELGIDPRHVNSLFTNSRGRTLKADLGWKIQQKYRIALRHSPLDSSAVVAVYYPFVFSENVAENDKRTDSQRLSVLLYGAP